MEDTLLLSLVDQRSCIQKFLLCILLVASCNSSLNLLDCGLDTGLDGFVSCVSDLSNQMFLAFLTSAIRTRFFADLMFAKTYTSRQMSTL